MERVKKVSKEREVLYSAILENYRNSLGITENDMQVGYQNGLKAGYLILMEKLGELDGKDYCIQYEGKTGDKRVYSLGFLRKEKYTPVYYYIGY